MQNDENFDKKQDGSLQGNKSTTKQSKKTGIPAFAGMTQDKQNGVSQAETSTTPIEQLIAQRKEKVAQLLSAGINPYPAKYQIDSTILDIQEKFSSLQKEEKSDVKVKIAGRAMTFRNMGKASFLDLRDGFAKIQIYIRADIIGADNYQMFKNIVDLSDIIAVEGVLFRTKTGELTIMAQNWTMLCKALRPLPEKWHGLKDIETRYRQRYIDLLSNENVKKIFIDRAVIISTIRRELENLKFIEVETPTFQKLAGGAEARPFVTHHNALNIDFFLRIAPELFLKRLIVGGIDRVFEIGKNFRNEGMDKNHSPEFTMLELYQAYADYNDMMDITEKLIKSAATAINADIELNFKREKLFDLIEKWAGIKLLPLIDSGKMFEAVKHLNLDLPKDASEKKIIDQILDEKVIPNLKEPTFIMDYPAVHCPLTKIKFDQPQIAERFELYMGGMEVANAYSELNDPQMQEKKFAEQMTAKAKGEEETMPYDEDFIVALQQGMPPTGGLGIGIDRLVMLLTGATSIREVVLFPALRT